MPPDQEQAVETRQDDTYLEVIRPPPREMTRRNIISLTFKVLSTGSDMGDHWYSQVLAHSFRLGPAKWVLVCPKVVAPSRQDLARIASTDVADSIYRLANSDTWPGEPIHSETGWMLA